jgi:hypothetical protein
MMIPAAALLVCGCGGINIETGPPSEEQATQTSEMHGRSLKSDFSTRMERATPLQKAWIWSRFVDSTTSRYLRIGREVADQWQRGNEGRGEDVSANEMQQVVANSIARDLPLLESYDDIVDYGYDLIRETYHFDAATEKLVTDVRDNYFDTYNFVFYPSGSQRDYSDGLFDREQKCGAVPSTWTGSWPILRMHP